MKTVKVSATSEELADMFYHLVEPYTINMTYDSLALFFDWFVENPFMTSKYNTVSSITAFILNNVEFATNISDYIESEEVGEDEDFDDPEQFTDNIPEEEVIRLVKKDNPDIETILFSEDGVYVIIDKAA